MVFKLLVRNSEGETIIKYSVESERGIVGCRCMDQSAGEGVIKMLGGKAVGRPRFYGLRMRIPFTCAYSQFRKGLKVCKEIGELFELPKLSRLLWDGPAKEKYQG